VLPARQFNLPELWQALGDQKRPDVFCSRSDQHVILLGPSGFAEEGGLHLHAGLDIRSYKLLELQWQLAGLLSTWMIGRFAEYDLKGRLSAVAGSPAPSVDNT